MKPITAEYTPLKKSAVLKKGSDLIRSRLMMSKLNPGISPRSRKTTSPEFKASEAGESEYLEPLPPPGISENGKRFWKFSKIPYSCKETLGVLFSYED